MVFSCFLSFVRQRMVNVFGRGVGRGCFNGGSTDGGDGFTDLLAASFFFCGISIFLWFSVVG